MNQTEQILSQLRDVQLPPAPEGVSLWLILANLLILLAIVLGLYRRRRRTHEQWRRDALFRIRQARNMATAPAILTLAKLLRQILLYRHGHVSNDTQAWLMDLDKEFATDWFTQSTGQIFGNALYKPPQLTDEALQTLCTQLERLIRKLPTRPRSTSLQQGSRAAR